MTQGWLARWAHTCERALATVLVCLKYFFGYLLVAPRRTVHFLWGIGHHILEYDRRHAGAQITQRSFKEIFPGIEQVDVTLTNPSWRDGNVTMAELYALCAIARHLRIQTALEIGTYHGLVMSQLVRNTEDKTRLFTLDLPQQGLEGLGRPVAPGEDLYIQKAAIGEKITQLPEHLRRRVTQLYGDSAQFDFHPYAGQIDLVFIDGSHAYHYVAHDSQEAFRMRSPRGLIVWQDYLTWPDVTRYLNELRHSHPLVQIEGTSLVVYDPHA